MRNRRISKNNLAILLFISISVITILFACLISALFKFDDSANDMRIGYAISTPEELYFIQNFENFDEEQLFIEGTSLQFSHEMQLSHLRYNIINIFLSMIIVTIITFLLYYYYTQEKDEKLNKIILAEANKLNDIENRQSHDLKLINEYLTHELKNSLSVLQAKVYLNSEDTIEYIKKMNSQIDDINALIEPEVNLEDAFIVDEMIDSLRLDVDQRTKFHIQDMMMIKGSDLLIERAIYNIVNNGFKYGADEVIVTARRHGKNAIFEIKNNGPKIKKEQLDKIFNMHYRINELNVDGSGIGLALVKNIVDIHKGSIYVESSENETCFYLSFQEYLTEED